jgi:hypothetical protein
LIGGENLLQSFRAVNVLSAQNKKKTRGGNPAARHESKCD